LVFCLCGENFVSPFSTLAMIKGSLPTNSTTPDRLRSWAKTESEDFLGFWVRTLSKKVFQKAHDRILIYTPKDAHSRIFVTGGSVIASQIWAKKKTYSWGGQLVIRFYLLRPLFCISHFRPILHDLYILVVHAF